MSVGVLNQGEMQELLRRNIKSEEHIEVSPDPSSLDIPVAARCIEMKASCRPGRDQSVTDIIRKFKIKAHDIPADGMVLRKNVVYLLETSWTLELPPDISAKATARSSIGRLDMLVRLIADHEDEFDHVSGSEPKKIWLEVIPITFDILIRPGTVLSQLRFTRGEERLSAIPREALRHELTPVLVNVDGTPADLKACSDDFAVLLSLELSEDADSELVGFVAKNSGALPPIDPSLRNDKKLGSDCRIDPHVYWEGVKKEDDWVKIEQDRFYIFRSKERFRIPKHMAVDCQAYSESLGDIRIHYAGFAHPYFGLDRNEGTPLIFEVRGFSMSTMLRDGAPLAKVYFRRMSQEAMPDAEQEYSAQELKLSGCFREW